MSNIQQVLDKGCIELVQVFGNDLMVVNAARVSFARTSTEFNDKDRKLLQYLADHKHVSPFYHPHLTFRIKAPISVQRQWYRHKIGTAENSESTRYIEVHEEFYKPFFFREQSKDNKQGSGNKLTLGGEEVVQYEAADLYEEAALNSFERYRMLLQLGVAKEQAREVLPLCTYTSWVWTASLMAVIHFLELREDSHAQYEIRSYAQAMRQLVEPHFPLSLAAFAARKSS